ncbi:MAG: ComF family protein, partial [Octadecabacter sp.]
QRFEALSGAIVPNPKRMALLNGRKVLLIDDVMTSGATFAAAAEACYSAGADDVCVLALARVVKDT